MDDLRKGKVMISIIHIWIDYVISFLTKFIWDLHKIFSLAEIVISEVRIQVIVWKEEFKRLSAMVTQLVNVEEYGLDKFLEDNSLKLFDDRADPYITK